MKKLNYYYTDAEHNNATKEDFWQEVGATFAFILFMGLCFVCLFL